jgi:hypothetical protein
MHKESNNLRKKTMKTLTQRDLKKMRPAQIAREMIDLAKDYPQLGEFYIDPAGNSASNIEAHTLLTMFRDKAFALSIISGQTKSCLTKNMDGAFKEPAPDTALIKFFMNCAMAEALIKLSLERNVKPHIWAQNATHLSAHLDAHENIEPDLKKNTYVIASHWFQNTIDEGKDGLNLATHGLAHMMYHHHPEDDLTAVEKAITLFTQNAARGYLPSMDAMAELLLADGALTPLERVAAISAIKSGAEKTPDGSGIILQKLAVVMPHILEPERLEP